MITKRLLVLVPIAALLLSSAASAGEEAESGEVSALETLVRQLGDAKHAVRRQAAEKLRAIGFKAAAALEKAAQSDDPEVAVSAAELLKDARLGIGPDWPAELAEKVRGWEKIADRDRLDLIRRVAAELKDRSAPFLLSRMASNRPKERRAAYECITETNDEKIAALVIERLKKPGNEWESRAAAWAYMRMDNPREALRLLAANKVEQNVVREIVQKSVEHVIDLLDGNKFREAAETASEFAAAAPDEARFLYLRAEALKKLGREAEADKLAAKALELNPNEEAPHYAAADMLMDMGLNELSAREWYAILKIPPSDDVYDMNAYMRLGQILVSGKQYGNAADNFEKGLALYKTKRLAGGSGYGLVGTSEKQLEETIKFLRGKQDVKVLVAGKPGEQLCLRVRAWLKDAALADFKKAVSAVRAGLTVNVQPLGIRLLDLDACTAVYDVEKEEMSVLLNNSQCCEPEKMKFDRKAGNPSISLSSLDCVYVCDVDLETGRVNRTARFEKDYFLKVEPDESLGDYTGRPLRIGETEYRWDDLLEGATVDYLPPTLELELDGKAPDGTARSLKFKIPINEKEFDVTERPSDMQAPK